MTTSHVFELSESNGNFKTPGPLRRSSSVPCLSQAYRDTDKPRKSLVPENLNISAAVEDSQPGSTSTYGLSNAKPTQINGKDLSCLTTEELKQELSSRQLSTTGKKAVLAERLKTAISNPATGIQTSRQTLTADVEDDSHIDIVDLANPSPAKKQECPCKAQYLDLKNQISKIEEVVQQKCQNSSNDRIDSLGKENARLRETLQALSEKLRETSEERDSLTMVVKILSKELYQNSQTTTAPKLPYRVTRGRLKLKAMKWNLQNTPMTMQTLSRSTNVRTKNKEQEDKTVSRRIIVIIVNKVNPD